MSRKTGITMNLKVTSFYPSTLEEDTTCTLSFGIVLGKKVTGAILIELWCSPEQSSVLYVFIVISSIVAAENGFRKFENFMAMLIGVTAWFISLKRN